MQPTMLAILSRFNGNRNAARNYCVDIAVDNSFKNINLSNEYWALAEYFSAERKS